MSSIVESKQQNYPQNPVMMGEIVETIKNCDPNCICFQRIADGTCGSYNLLVKVRNCLSLHASMKWKFLFRSRSYRMKVLIEMISACLAE
jgi:hypothetical protein